ncbi:MAG TPA: twin transmembrane helix small protein [Aestuariivirga sp.]
MGNLIITISMAAVVVVLVLGLINMMRGGSANRSQSLMRWRVGLQFATILIVILVLWLRG